MNLVNTNSEELVEIVERIIAGDSSAEDEIVSRYRDGIAVIIGQIVRSEPATEDVSQETFRIVLEKLRRGDLRQHDRLSGFVCGVAKNAAIHYVRRATRLTNIDEIASAENIPDDAPSQLDEILRKEKADVVRQTIDELKVERDRVLILRYYFDEEDKDKICQDLGLTKAQFSRIIYRALARFKELLARKRGESGP